MMIFIYFLIGIVSWPVLEYLLHRFLGHDLKLNTEFKKQHTRHHVETDYFAPNLLKAVAAIPAGIVAMAVVSFISGSWQLGLGFTVGFISMYTFYELVHWTFHFHEPKTSLGMKLRKHHFAHHFHNAKMNHGVTSTLLDRLFGTYIDVPVVKVPKQIVLPWMLDSDQKGIHPKFAKDFQIK